MNPLNANLETSKQQQQQPNSQAAIQSAPTQKPQPQQQTNSPPNNEPEKPLSLAELFAGESEDEGSEESDDDPSKPLDSIERLIKRNGLTPEQAYAIKIPMPNGQEAVTIGELKDRFAEFADLEQRELQFDTRRVKQEGEILRAQNEVRSLLTLLPKEAVTPAIINKLRQQHDAVQTRERAATLEVIPEWSDNTRMLDDKKGMNALLADYGFDETFLESIVDHRAIKFVRDMYLRDKRIKAALAKVETQKPKGHAPSSKGKPAKRPGPHSNSNRIKGAVSTGDKIRELFGD